MTADSDEKRPPLGDPIARGLRLLIVAIDPSSRSGGIGYSFSSPSNPFWRLLYESGLTPVLLDPCEEHRLLDHGIGLVSTVLRATPAAAELTLVERRAGAARVRGLVERYEPLLVALLGLTLYFGSRRTRMGTFASRAGSDVPVVGGASRLVSREAVLVSVDEVSLSVRPLAGSVRARRSPDFPPRMWRSPGFAGEEVASGVCGQLLGSGCAVVFAQRVRGTRRDTRHESVTDFQRCHNAGAERSNHRDVGAGGCFEDAFGDSGSDGPGEHEGNQACAEAGGPGCDPVGSLVGACCCAHGANAWKNVG
jgi:TDG/mug DNA glycosylase family protein